MSKKKILIISDHALLSSGVGVQTRYLVEGLLKKNDMTFIQLGAAKKHSNYNTVKVCDDFFIKPINGFGNKNLLRSVLLNEKPDALIIFTDPRFFTWLFEIEDEIRQVCPILWWHVWDNEPVPKFNNWMYESTNAINCHSYLTYKMCSQNFKDKTSFIPHALPDNLFFRLPKHVMQKEKERILGKERANHFVCLWANRNCDRKRPGDVLYSWRMFLDLLSEEEKQKVTLLMHTNPTDPVGQNLFEIGDMLNLLDTVCFSTENVDTSLINVLHNIADVTLNISYNEGFGLTTLESMQVGTPIIAAMTGGLYRQVIDYRDNSQNGIGLEIDIRTLSGTQDIPYIFKDLVDCSKAGRAIKQIFDMSEEEMLKLSHKVEMYAKHAFSYQKTIDDWHDSILKCIKEFNEEKNKSDMEIQCL